MAPEYFVPDDLHVEIISSKDGLAFLGRVDFDSINEVYHRHIPASHSSVTPAYLLAQFLDARKELTLAADMNTELWVGDGLSAILQQRVKTILEATTKSKDSIAYFHNVEFEGRRFREAVNSSERTGAELIALLRDEETIKFKKWLANQKPDGHLIQEYDRAVFGRHGWIERLPFKLGKIATFAGIGGLLDLGLGTMGLASLAAAGVSAASDVAVGATDEFVLSKLLDGWKPNQFIEGPAADFLKKPRTAD